jgi:transaldolase/glucose-6-phosphate isomerase
MPKGLEMNLKQILVHGQAVWLDYIRRDLLSSGEFARLVRDDGVRGVTTNPSILERAIAGSAEYDQAIGREATRGGESATSLYERLAIEDLRSAADTLRPVYDATGRRDGYVSMEVSPRLAHDTAGTLDEARRLWAKVDRPNLMIKVPATPEGIPAIERLTGEGLNVNVTLLFSRAVCQQVVDAYMSGLEILAKRGGSLDAVASVASMFVSRVDAKVDPELEARLASASGSLATVLRNLVGKVAIANAKLAYQDREQTWRSERWRALVRRGARAQRLLWASTSTKDARLRDVLYVEELIGPGTVVTVTPETLAALRHHGTAANRLAEDVDGAREVMNALARVGISIDDVARQLLDDGVRTFSSAFDRLLESIETKRHDALAREMLTTEPRTSQADLRR